MSRIRTVALSAVLMAATAGAVSAQTMQGTPRSDSAAKAGDMRRGGPGQRRGEMGPGDRAGMERGMRGHHGMRGHEGMRGAPGRGGPGMMGREGMPGMDFMRGLNLTETQRTQIRAIHEKYQPQASTLHEQMFREVRTVLTAEQRAKIDAQIAERIKKLDEDKARLERLRR